MHILSRVRFQSRERQKTLNATQRPNKFKGYNFVGYYLEQMKRQICV